MDNKIMIIEGPTPTFEPVTADWVEAINETPQHYNVMLTNLRTMNGRGLVERCYQTWAQQDIMYLHFRNAIGLEQKVPIIAAQNVETEDGQKLVLWVRVSQEELRQTVHFDDNND